MKNSILLLTALALPALSTLSGCAMESADVPISTGQVRMNLEGTAPSGAVFRLINASFLISGPSNQTITPAEDVDSVLVNLPAGSYTIELLDGWSFAQVALDGSQINVDAVLVSSNPQNFSISDGNTTNVQFIFESTETVELGAGTLDLSIEVLDGSSVLVLADFDDGQYGNEPSGNWILLGGGSSSFVSTNAPQGEGYLRVMNQGSLNGGVFYPDALIDTDGYSSLSLYYRSSAPFDITLDTPETYPAEQNPNATCTNNCWDAFDYTVPASNDWTQVTIPLSAFSQEGWGTPAQNGLASILGMVISGQGQVIDLDYIRLH